MEFDQNTNIPVEPPVQPAEPSPEELKQQRRIIIGLSIAAVLFVALIVVAVIALLQPATPTDKIRDIFIIFMALETLLIGFVLVILIIQLARLINLLQNEIKPILDSTNETVSTLRGTATFLSENLTGPLVQLNSYVAALNSLVEALGLGKRKKRKSNNDVN